MFVAAESSECFAICAPDGPSTPFAYPVLWVDILRLIIMVLGVTIIVLTPRLMLRAVALGQVLRLGGAGCFALISIGTEVDHLGDYPHYRLFVMLLGVCLMSAGIWRMRREIPPTTHGAENRTSE